MTLEQLRIFVAGAERQHVTHAAAELRLTQSAFSSAIAALETRRDIRLFDRVGRNIVLNKTARSSSRNPGPCWRGRRLRRPGPRDGGD